MKIAVYGDSFAESSAVGLSSWVDHLSKEFDVTNYGMNASNLCYSYDLFLKHNTNYDMNIFMVTSYGRQWIPNLQSIKPGVPGINGIEAMLKLPLTDLDRKLLNAAKSYFVHIEYWEHSKLLHEAIVKDLQMHSNVIAIPCFPIIYSGVLDWHGPTMVDISNIDLRYYGLSDYLDKMELRACHMNDANNLMFANKIKEYILSDMHESFKIDINDYIEPIGEPIEKYFY